MLPRRLTRIPLLTLPRVPLIAILDRRGRGLDIDGRGLLAALLKEAFRLAQFFGQAERMLDAIENYRE